MNKDIIKMLILLELSTEKPYSEKELITNFRKLSKIYHPDVATEQYKDGEKFKELLSAKEYLLTNICVVNNLINNNSMKKNKYSQEKQYEEQKKHKYENIYQNCFKQCEHLKIENDTDELYAKNLLNSIYGIHPYKETQLLIKKINDLISNYHKKKAKEAELKRQKEIQIKLYNDANDLLNIEVTRYNKNHFKEVIDKIKNLDFKDSREIYYNLKKKYNDYLEKEKNKRLLVIRKVIKFSSISIATITGLAILIIIVINLIVFPIIEYNESLQSYNCALETIELGDYAKAEEILNDMDFKESRKIYEFLMARKEFNCGDYEKGIDIIYKCGGTVNIDYDAIDGNCKKESETIKLTNYIDNDPQKKGYQFNQWKIDKYVIDYNNFFVDLKLIAVYDEIVYNIYYKLLDDDFDGPKTYKITDDFDIGVPAVVGYEFIGWKDLSTDKVFERFNVNGYNYDLTLEALYKAKTYNIYFDTKGGDLNQEYQTVEYNSKFDLPIPTKIGYRFMGWKYNGEIFNKIYWNIDDNITLFAYWKPMSFSISYTNLFDNELSKLPTSYEYSIDNSYSIPTINRLGYTFISWTLNDEYISEIPEGYIGDIVLSPIFEPKKYKVTYDYADGIHNPIVVEILYNELVSLEEVYERDYYIFEGWYLDDSIFIATNWNILSDIKLVAKWNMIEYKIDYNISNSIINNNPSSYNIKSEISFENPIREGYTFAGWYLDNKYEILINGIELGSSGDIEIYPKWIENKCQISYIDITGEIKKHESTSITVMTSNDEWVYSAGKHELEKIEVTGNLNLILLKNSSLFISDSIYIPEGYTMTIYSENGISGNLIVGNNIACGSDGQLGDIGGENGSNLIVAGGTIEAIGICNGGNGLTDENDSSTGGWGGNGGVFTLYNGVINAKSISNGGTGGTGGIGSTGAAGTDGTPSSWYYDEYWNEWYEIYAKSPTAGGPGGEGGFGGEGGYGGIAYIYGGKINCESIACGGAGGAGGIGGTGGTGGKNTSGVVDAKGGNGGTGGWAGSGGLAGTVYSIIDLDGVTCSTGGKGGTGGAGGTGGIGSKNGTTGTTGKNGVDRPSNEIIILE